MSTGLLRRVPVVNPRLSGYLLPAGTCCTYPRVDGYGIGRSGGDVPWKWWLWWYESVGTGLGLWGRVKGDIVLLFMLKLRDMSYIIAAE